MIELDNLYAKLTRVKEALTVNHKHLNQCMRAKSDAKRVYESFTESSKHYPKQQFKRFLTSLIGREGQYIEKTEQSRAKAYKQLNDCTEALEQAYLEQERLENERRQLTTQLHALKQQLNKTSNTYREEVMEAFSERKQWGETCEEIDEAFSIGQKILRYIDEAIDALDSAKSWSTVDMLGGGFLTDVVKYDHIDKAESIMQKVEVGLMRYQEELKDVSYGWGSGYEYLSNSHRLMDFMLDNIFTDVSNYNKIQDNLSSLENLLNQITTSQHRLSALRKQVEKEIEQSLDLYDLNKNQS
ncbi:hypothetical protein [Marinilactibacillus sp. Marseille-P9653]|uniref:hypothetical protein n=1 Tax=Marinilactibacillus sp. Marseille-P9653 TaxID=2866583 RepID=UPI001CE48E99|nr:hypothetical protein [Marinilactibacillus sp. Marseille-P9653]